MEGGTVATTEEVTVQPEIPGNSGEIQEKEDESIRDEKGRIKPGFSLNPEGKKAGTKHFKTLFIEAVKEIGAKNARGEDISKDKVIVKKIIDQAMAGNLKAADMVIGRVDGDKEDAPLLQVNVIALTQEQQNALNELL